MIKDFSNLRLSHNLYTLNLSYTKIKNEDLIYLEYMNIHDLDISHCVNISDISYNFPLASISGNTLTVDWAGIGIVYTINVIATNATGTTTSELIVNDNAGS
jgi:hypothetical protein